MEAEEVSRPGHTSIRRRALGYGFGVLSSFGPGPVRGKGNKGVLRELEFEGCRRCGGRRGGDRIGVIYELLQKT